MENLSILVVDDEPEVCEMVADWLGDDGLWNVDYTTEPLRALEQVSAGRYDVMVTDLRMPQMDGLELARQARGVCPGLGVVAITGYPSVQSSVAALREGFIDYVEKPFLGDDIRAAVFRAMARRQQDVLAESAADEVTSDNAHLSVANGDLRERLDLAGRELTLLHHRLAGRVADLKLQCDCADALDGQRDIPELLGTSLVLLRQQIDGDEHAILLLEERPSRCLAAATVEGDDIVVHWSETRLSRGVVRAVARRGQAALVEDAGASPVVDDLSPWITARGCVVVLPLVGGGRVQGVAVVRRDEAGQVFGEAEIRRVLRQGEAVGRAIDIAMSLRRQRLETHQGLERLVQAVENRSEATRGHGARVARMAVRAARRLGVDGQTIETLDMAARIHDIGKVLLPADLVAPTGPLSDDQRERLASHKELGWQLLKPVKFLRDAAKLVRRHHDLGDGAAVAPELLALAAAETYDELTHDGPHGSALSPEEALAALEQAGTDDRVIQAIAHVALATD